MKLASLLGHVHELLALVADGERPADLVLDGFFRARRYLGSRDRRFVSETSFGVLRHRRRAEALVEAALLEVGDRPLAEDFRLLVITAYLVAIAGVEVSPEAVAEKLKDWRLKEPLPDILERLRTVALAEPAGAAARLGLRHSFPDWMAERFIALLGEEEALRLAAALNQPAPLCLRVNTLRATREACREALAAEGVASAPTALSPWGLVLERRVNLPGLDSFRRGLFEVQDEASQIVALLVDAAPGQRVLDACAGSGGKSLALAAAMEDRGMVVAADVSEARLRPLAQRAARAGATCVRPRLVGSLYELTAEGAIYDRVLVDAPCSLTGTLRRNPGLKWTLSETAVAEAAARQLSILEEVASLLKPGGRLVYATCSMLREEDEDVVAAFLARHGEFTLTPPAEVRAKLGLGGIAAGDTLRLWPHRHGTDGFYAAVLARN